MLVYFGLTSEAAARNLLRSRLAVSVANLSRRATAMANFVLDHVEPLCVAATFDLENDVAESI